MYELLHGKPPFNPDVDIRGRVVEKNFMRKELVFKEGLSDEVRECLKGILNVDPEKRPTAVEVLEMSFFKISKFFK